MLKYVDTKVVFAEVPDEVTLAINISNCPCHCDGCHSEYLADASMSLFISTVELLVWHLWEVTLHRAKSHILPAK